MLLLLLINLVTIYSIALGRWGQNQKATLGQHTGVQMSECEAFQSTKGLDDKLKVSYFCVSAVSHYQSGLGRIPDQLCLDPSWARCPSTGLNTI